MAVKTEQGVTTLTPTAWKWMVGAAFSFVLIPGFGALIAIFFVLTGLGVLQRLTLSKEGITVRNWFSEKSYAWSEIEDFRVHKVKSGVITAANMVSFTHADKKETMMGKTTKLFVGGTHSIPAVGMKAAKLVQVMQAYKLGFVPEETPVAVQQTQAAKTAAPTRPRAVPAIPKAQKKPQRPQTSLSGKRKAATPLVEEGGGLFGRRRSTSLFNS